MATDTDQMRLSCRCRWSSVSGDIELWALSAYMTAYRAYVMRVGLHDTLVAVQPAGGAVSLHPSRMWGIISDSGVLHQSYVSEKFRVRGADAVALTTLIAVALGREPAVTPAG